MALGRAGAVASSGTGDPGTGEFEEAKVLATFGEVSDVAGGKSSAPAPALRFIQQRIQKSANVWNISVFRAW
jgi:hypothetical protein